MVAQGWRRLLARPRQNRAVEAEPQQDDAEAVVSTFFSSYSIVTASARRRLLRQVPMAVAATRAARSLPVLTIDVSDSREGQVIRRGLAHFGRRTYKTAFIRTPLHEVASVLILPTSAQEYANGASKQTVRRKSRAALKAGVRWAPLDDIDERRRLIAMSEARERLHPKASYRSENVDNSRLLAYRMWLVAYSADDVPLLMAVVPTDGAWSMLAYFRTLEDSTAASNARYLMSSVLAEELVARRVRYLVDTATMSNLSVGLRHFQHMLGYRVVRVRLSPSRRPRLRSASRRADAARSRAPEPDATGVRRVDPVVSGAGAADSFPSPEAQTERTRVGA